MCWTGRWASPPRLPRAGAALRRGPAGCRFSWARNLPHPTLSEQIQSPRTVMSTVLSVANCAGPSHDARMQQIPLYEQVSSRLEEAMRVGALRPGDRLPSVRRLSLRERVSISTVLQAYLQLEARGLIEARPQSGHYVRRQRPLPPEPPATRPAPGATPVTISALVAKVVESARDPDLVPLGCNQPAPELFPWAR